MDGSALYKPIARYILVVHLQFINRTNRRYIKYSTDNRACPGPDIVCPGPDIVCPGPDIVCRKLCRARSLAIIILVLLLSVEHILKYYPGATGPGIVIILESVVTPG